MVESESVADYDSDFDFDSDFDSDPEFVDKSDSESVCESDSDSDFVLEFVTGSDPKLWSIPSYPWPSLTPSPIPSPAIIRPRLRV